MENLNNIGLDKSKSEELAKKLNILLANYSIFYQNTRGYHWNVKGHKFFELHLKFEELYNVANLGVDETAPHHHSLQRVGNRHAVTQWAPLQDHQLLDCQCQAHSHQNVKLVGRCIHVAQEQLLRGPTNRANHQRHYHQSQPEAHAPSRHLVAKIRSYQIEGPMREVHESQQTKNNGQAHRQQEIQHADADPIDDL